MPRQGCPRLPVGSARNWPQQQYYSERCQNHPPPRGGVSRENSRISWRMPRSDGPKALPPKGKGTPGASRCDFPIHAGSLGPHRAHAGRNACSPGSPRQRAPPPRLSSLPRREGAPRLPGPQAFSRAIRRAPFPTRFRAPTTITMYSGETRPELWLADYRLAYQLGGTDDDNLIIRNLPLFLSDAARAWLEHLPLCRSPTGTTWSKPLPETSRAHTCALGTPGISEAAASIRENPCGTTSGDFRSSAPSCPTSPTQMSSARSSPAPLAATW
jgi:hypothetical protein